MNQKELASAVGVSPGAVTAWVKNDSDPTQKNLESILDALDVTWVEFYGPVPEAKAKPVAKAKSAAKAKRAVA